MLKKVKIEADLLNNDRLKTEQQGSILRGSIYYQTSILAKEIFEEGLKKSERVDAMHESFKGISSFQSMESYRRIWNNLGKFIKAEFGINNFEALSAIEVAAFMRNKVDEGKSKKYLQKINSALGKLEHALNRWSQAHGKAPKKYDFSIRQSILDHASKNAKLYNGYHDRCYEDVDKLIELLEPFHKTAAIAQCESGIRVEALIRIQHMIFKGKKLDLCTQNEVWIIETKEKGGKVGEAFVSLETYRKLKQMKQQNAEFSYVKYAQDIRHCCHKLGIPCEGSHGFRWTFARNRLRCYQAVGYSYDEAMQEVSYEMKHNRKNISEHYIGTQQS